MSKANDKGRGRNRTSRPAPEGITADSLMRRKFPPPRFVIPHLLPAGLTVLASKLAEKRLRVVVTIGLKCPFTGND